MFVEPYNAFVSASLEQRSTQTKNAALKVFILHDNEPWLGPFREAFARLGIEHEEWDLGQGGSFDLNSPPPEGIFFNRVSPSSHTRGARFSLEYATSVLEWLELYGRRIINGPSALQMELSKARQQSRLEAHGIKTPRTVFVTGTGEARNERLLAAARENFTDGGFLVKINRGGSGSGVELFNSVAELEMFLEAGMLEEALDATYLVQEFIQAPDRTVTRCEFVGGKLVYGVRIDTSEGFHLCPADACERPQKSKGPKFQIVPEMERHPLVPFYESFLQKYNIEVAGIELVTDSEGNAYTYDCNSNTNYNTATEVRAFGENNERGAAFKLAQYLLQLIEAETIKA